MERFHAPENRGQTGLDYAEARKRSDEIQRFHAAENRGQTGLDYAEARKRSDEIQRNVKFVEEI